MYQSEIVCVLSNVLRAEEEGGSTYEQGILFYQELFFYQWIPKMVRVCHHVELNKGELLLDFPDG